MPGDLLQCLRAVLLAEDLEQGLGFDPVEHGEVPDAGPDEAVNVELVPLVGHFGGVAVRQRRPQDGLGASRPAGDGVPVE